MLFYLNLGLNTMFKSKFPFSGLSQLLRGAVCATGITFSALAFSAPGAHGPNGEHLDVDTQVQQTENPKFESFTESFELLGEVFSDKVRLYLHDFSTNKPVANASIELESDTLSVQAGFSDDHQYYVIRDEAFVSKLNQPGEHEIVVTILTEEHGDLLASTLLTPEAASAPQHGHEEEHHHAFPWTTVAIALVFFAAGLALAHFVQGRRK
ncbi:hypothetical protein [Lacimicrobium alkaliphilum]|uniref:hypothetical protein n=2 Tax=Lacimicrobium alkaliphilum TaxID=1526571 RepID=UPI00117B370C|nr:hypothetical protein [Lacimicrobium alkaliphilum]